MPCYSELQLHMWCTGSIMGVPFLSVPRIFRRCIPSPMPRVARVVVPGMPHHITQRGSRRYEVFRDEADRLEYLELLCGCCRDGRLRIVAYCLMTNHVHFVAVPERLDSIERVFHRLDGTHAQRFNIKYGFVGHLWQERPFSCVLDPAHLLSTVRYVEQNPVRARMVGKASDYRWSSALSHCTGIDDPVLYGSPAVCETGQWAAWLEGVSDPEIEKLIRDCTSTGRPCGDESFVKNIEEITNRDFTRKKSGRKARAEKQTLPLLDWSEDRIIR